MFRLGRLDPWMGFGLDYALGAIFLSLLWMGWGLVGLWFAPFLMAVILLLLILSFLGRRRSGDGILGSWPREIPLRFLMGVAVIYGLFTLLHGLLPETHPDGLVYHLGTLSYWMFRHGLADLPSQPFGGFPYGGELYFLSGYVLQGTESAKCLNIASLGVLGMVAGAWAAEIGGERARWLALGMVLTLPLAHLVSWTSQVEVLQSLFLLLFLYALERAGVGRNWAMLAGLLGGMALAIKYTSVFGWAAGILALSMAGRGPRPFRNWEPMGWILGLAAIVAGSWALKNFVYTGDPFYPYLQDWIGARHMSAVGYRSMLQDQGLWTHGGRGWEAPWYLLMTRPALFNFAGPLPLALAPLGLLLAFRKVPSRFLSWVIPFLWVSGLFVTGILKFHLPALVLTLLFIAACLGPGDGVAEKRWAAWLPALTGILCFPFLAGLSSVYYPGGGVWTCRESVPAYLERAVRNPYEGLCGWVGQELPKDARLLIVGDARGLYYPRSFQTDTGYDLSFLTSLAERGLDSAGIGKEVRKMGFTHVVVNTAQGITAASMFPTHPLDARQWKELDGFVRRGLDVLHEEGYGFILKVRD
ncbi:MAG TPA: hypothetical protein VHE12_10020, partial [bacterium]|nr:hypothetical protein [bacterium]